jgi:MoaA/NifB/PqqE/SkfB family radical SAM enzyme
MKLVPYYKYLESPEANLENFPKSFQINLTNKCYSRCIGCRKYEWPDTELSFDQVKSVINFLAKHHGHSIVLSGGEPACHPNFIEICKYIKDKNLELGILTSAIFPKMMDLKSWALYPDWVAVSIDGPTALEYKRVRGIDAFNIVIDNIKQLKKIQPEIKIRCNATISKENFYSMGRILTLCEELQIDCYFFPIHTWKELQVTNLDIQLHFMTLFRLMSKDIKIKTNVNDFVTLMKRKKPSVCIATYFHAFIDSDGLIFPCCRLANDNGDFSQRNLKMSLGHIDGGLENIWSSEKSKKIRQKLCAANERECTFCDRYNKINTDYADYKDLRDKKIFL